MYIAALLALQFPLPAKVESRFLHLPISSADHGFEDIQRHISLEDLQDDSTSGMQATPYWPASRLGSMLGKLVGGPWGLEVKKRVQDQWWLQLGYR